MAYKKQNPKKKMKEDLIYHIMNINQNSEISSSINQNSAVNNNSLFRSQFNAIRKTSSNTTINDTNKKSEEKYYFNSRISKYKSEPVFC